MSEQQVHQPSKHKAGACICIHPRELPRRPIAAKRVQGAGVRNPLVISACPPAPLGLSPPGVAFALGPSQAAP